MLFLKLGFRNLLRNKRRTFLTATAMVGAVSLLILTLGVNDGIIWGIINSATETVHGHLTITDPDFFEKPSINRAIPHDEALRSKFLSNPLVKGVCGRISCFALLSCGKDDRGLTQAAELLGIDPSEERNVSRLERCVSRGAFLTRPDGNGIILGEGLASRLEATVGSEIVMMGQASDGSVAAEVLNVEGLLKTDDNVRDASLALVGRSFLQAAFTLEGRIHKWNLFLHDPLQARRVGEELGKGNPRLLMTIWQKLIPQMAVILDIWAGIQVFMMIIFYFAVFLVTVNVMNMAFLERLREFAILGAIGLTKVRLGFLIFTESLLLSGLSGLIGGVLGLGMNLLLMKYPIDLTGILPPISYGGGALPAELASRASGFNTLMPVFAMLILGASVSLFPILRLARLRPVEALRDS